MARPAVRSSTSGLRRATSPPTTRVSGGSVARQVTRRWPRRDLACARPRWSASTDRLDRERARRAARRRCRPAPRPSPESPVFHNQETPAGRVQVVVATGVPLEPPPLPESWLAAAGWSLVPVAGEVGDAWVERIPDAAVVAVGWQGMLRTLVAGERVERRPPVPSRLLRRADLVGVSRYDVAPSTRLADLAGFSRRCRLLVTQGTRRPARDRRRRAGRCRSFATAHANGSRAGPDRAATRSSLRFSRRWCVRASPVRGPHVGRLDLRFAAAAGSLAVEGIGLAGVPDLPAVLRRRSRERIPGDLPSADAQVGAVPADAVEDDPATDGARC